MSLLLFLSCLFFTIVSQVNAIDYCDNNRGNYTANSTYDNNLKTLLSSFSSHTQINYGFYNFSYGHVPDKAYAIGLCWGDLKPNECLTNINNSIVSLRQQCPNQKEAIAWDGDVTLWYSNRSIFGVVETDPTRYLYYDRNANNVGNYSQTLSKLMINLKNKAASGDSRRKYDADHLDDPVNFATIHGVVQCMPDISGNDCYNCLEDAISEIPFCCNGKMGGHVYKPSCRLRFDPYRFYNPTIELDSVAPSPSPSPFTNNTFSGHSKIRTVIDITVPVAAVVLALIFICIYLKLRKPKQNFEANNGEYDIDNDDEEHEDETTIIESLLFSFDTIRVATNDFSDSNKIGQGGFGVVYRGQLSNGQMIAVKRLSTDSDQGDLEFKNEVLLVAKLQHRNLVKLLGFSQEGRERLLIYEFVLNKSLDYFIFDPIKKAQLNWGKRYAIIRGIARGLLYLHEDSRLRIIHRDLKASNILLDSEMNAKIADFGLARLFVIDQTQANTNRIVGTYGYMAPEYALHGQFSVKSDVFSFGVLILEIISGHKNSKSICLGDDIEYLFNYAWKSWKNGRATDIIDHSLNHISQHEIMRCIHIGLLCIQENVADRPTMATIALMLNSNSLHLPIPLKPAYFFGDLDTTTSSVSINEASITDPYPR